MDAQHSHARVCDNAETSGGKSIRPVRLLASGGPRPLHEVLAPHPHWTGRPQGVCAASEAENCQEIEIEGKFWGVREEAMMRQETTHHSDQGFLQTADSQWWAENGLQGENGPKKVRFLP